MNQDKKNIIRNIYLYLVTLIGLIMVVIPAVDLIKITLESTLFPLAAEDEYYDRGPEPYMLKTNIDPNSTEPVTTVTLNESDQQLFENWKENYRRWEERENDTEKRMAIRRQRALVRDISTLIVGLALFLSHGSIIRKKHKK